MASIDLECLKTIGDALFDRAGTVIKKGEPKYTVTGEVGVSDDTVKTAIDEVAASLQLPYSLKDYQRTVVSNFVLGHDVLLIRY